MSAAVMRAWLVGGWNEEIERETRARTGPLLGIVLRASGAVLAAAGLIGVASRTPPLWSVYIAFGVWVVLGLLLHARGHVRAAGIALSLGFWLTASAAVLLLGGVRSPGSFVLLPVVLTAGLFWSLRAAVALTVASVALELAAAWLEARHLLPRPPRPMDAAALWRVLAGSLVMTGVLVVMALRTLRAAIQASVNHVAERKLEAARLCELERRLEAAQRLETITRLAGGVAHDFNNLLTIVLGSSALLARDLPAGSEQRERASEIHDAAMRGAALVRQLLAVGRQPAQPQRLDLGEMIDSLRPLLVRLAGAQIPIHVVPGVRPCWVWADRTQVEQVVLNLVVNARDAMPAGGQLTLAMAPPAASDCPETRGLAVLSVSDTGVGMDAATQRTIFEPFFTTKGAEGTGLGLAVVDGIVRQWGGQIRVESRPGRGARFDVFLPSA